MSNNESVTTPLFRQRVLDETVMDEMEIDTMAREAAREVMDLGAKHMTGEMARSARNGVLASPKVTDFNGPAVEGEGAAGPKPQIGPVQQTFARQTQALSAQLSAGGVYTPLKSLTGPASASDDELQEAWTIPITQPKLLATGLCYDVRMRYHCELDPPKQRLDFHPEDPRRIYHIYRELCQAGLYKDPQFNVPMIEKPLQRIQARNATAAEICLVHTISHYNFVESTAGKPLWR